MMLEVRSQVEGKVATLNLQGCFDYNALCVFRHGYQNMLMQDGINVVEIDFQNVSYIDSSALGELLILREKGQRSEFSVILANCSERVRRDLETAHFHKLFTVH